MAFLQDPVDESKLAEWFTPPEALFKPVFSRVIYNKSKTGRLIVVFASSYISENLDSLNEADNWLIRFEDDNSAQILNKFRRYFTARVDVKLMTTSGDFQIVGVSDSGAKVDKPAWFQKNGIGYKIHSYAGKLEFVAKATSNGQLILNLKGLDVRNPEDKSKRIPYWIDYTKLTVDGKIIFDKITPAWHDKPYRYTLDVKADAEIKIQIEWLPHRSDT